MDQQSSDQDGQKTLAGDQQHDGPGDNKNPANEYLLTILKNYPYNGFNNVLFLIIPPPKCGYFSLTDQQFGQEQADLGRLRPGSATQVDEGTCTAGKVRDSGSYRTESGAPERDV